jgi:hypothetical protein
MSTVKPQLTKKYRQRVPSLSDNSYPCQGQWLVLLGCYEKNDFSAERCRELYNKLAKCEDSWKQGNMNKSSANFHMRRMIRGLPFQLPRTRL